MRRVVISLAVTALACAGGCFNPDTPGTFACSSSDDRCPAGTTCDGKTCVPDDKKPDQKVAKKDTGITPDKKAPGKDKGKKADKKVPAKDMGNPLDKAAPQPDKQLPKKDKAAPKPDKTAPKPDKAAPKPDKSVVTCTAAQCKINNKCFNNKAYKAGSLCSRCLPAINPTGWMPTCVKTLAGSGASQFKDGAAASAMFKDPKHLAVVGAGATAKIYITDTTARRVRLLDRSTGNVSTAAGNGNYGNKTGSALQSEFSNPEGITANANGDIYFVDATTKQLNKLSGGVVSVYTKFSYAPSGITRHLSSFYVSTDSINPLVYKIDIKKNVKAYAGTGTAGKANGALGSATFMSPYDVAADASGVLYVADAINYRVRKVTASLVSDFAGTGNYGYLEGAALTSGIGWSYGIATDSAGRVYLSDSANCSIRVIHKGQMVTLVGKGPPGKNGCGDQDGDALVAKLDEPYGITVDSAGRVYFADRKNFKVKMLVF